MNLLASALRRLADRLDPPVRASTEAVTSSKDYFTTPSYMHEPVPIRRKAS